MITFLKDLFTTKKIIPVGDAQFNHWLPIKYAESNWDKIVIRNEKGWLRICTCMSGKHGRLSFYDFNDMEIKGFKATEFLRLSDAMRDKDYVIAIAKHFKLTSEDLK